MQLGYEADVGALNRADTATFLPPGIIPLQRAARSATLAPGSCIKHTVVTGEATYDIARMYGDEPYTILLNPDNNAAYRNAPELAWPTPGSQLTVCV